MSNARSDVMAEEVRVRRKDRGLNIRRGSGPARLLACFVGVGLACIGTIAAMACYRLLEMPLHIEYRWLAIGATGGLAFFMLRGAWYAFIPAKTYNRAYNPYSTGKRF